ncbi:lysoplasmalogenase [uncultured Roseovarius sp.]|uniref:lysoplasmalogenase n=1 Tax=uncultured Roseovarius sp. TaxID=293344 RepID=UPI0025D36156|nr:lysoplasmalogenase [uncultured Roseovarius sp.]
MAGAAALAYGLWYCHRAPSLLRSVIKTLPLAVMAGLAFFAAAPLVLVAGFALSALGDLALSRRGEAAFLTGLVGFAAAHIAFIWVFAGMAQGALPLVPAVILLIYAASSELWLAPHTGTLRWPVRGYVALIAGMGLMALMLPVGYGIVTLGAVLFIASDTLLAVQMFRMAADHPLQRVVSVALWALYIAAQGLILWGFTS